MPSRVRCLLAFVFAAAVLTPATASADEPWLLTLEGAAAAPVGEPQADLFGLGGAATAGLYRPLVDWLSLGVRVRGGLLADGDPPADAGREDPELGSFNGLSLAARIRPLTRTDDPRRSVGPFIEVGGGPALTGELLRGSFEAGLGWGFPIGSVGLAPTARYVQILQPEDNLDGSDARLVMLGLELTFFDARPEPPPPPPPPPPPGDRDGDGIVDPRDACPDDPEDRDDVEDADGCPDPDNDGDGILDGDDGCPLEPEDADGFQDEDGCPDPDNDGDGILDEDDDCPNEPEVVNGVEDEDGCPDEGLIELVDDKIIIDDTVLFAYNRAFVRPAAAPLIEAIITLWRQHPEWERVRIAGHTDRRGPDDYNQRLSERRAEAVMQALIERGMPEDMIEAVGYGETQPLNWGDREATHRRNRRVEFVVIAKREVRGQEAQEAEGAERHLDVLPEEEE